MTYEHIVIGGGIVGLATAVELATSQPGRQVLLLEKETRLGLHQTGHNSGVIHAGIYYKPGSLKADLCRRGAEATKAFCREHGIPFKTPGKLVVATNADEHVRLRALQANAKENGIDVEYLDATELTAREPDIIGVGALRVKASGIVDYRRICDVLGNRLRELGGTIMLGINVDAITETSGEVVVEAGSRQWRARQLVACAGLQSDRLARLAGLPIEHQIVPFRGEYYDVAPARRGIVQHMIYPVPDPAMPFLGIHLTPMIDGGLTVGPNAVLGLAREGYGRLSVSVGDVADYLRFPGFWKVIARHWRSALTEGRNSLSKASYLAECRKYCPSLELDDLLPREAGIRAQAVMRNGTLVHDFLFLQSPRMLHVCNAPSPAATAALPIAQMIAERARSKLD
ncbi:L-2-hydroxyglutarate oxidase [Faunimonas pinastri]|uniref:L-2-hydroxyglutarate oxidase n=1 Tax=Faunimonas pinastri TaxID=1855383 RepID=A0A1H9E4T2_9HYPH|nr:L-2-hydroxyglutarate oxidase [Faunimonas pinastri]SEQ20645.1 L-2-hydroxyglutarate oxidase [Faunimonas pinastri]